MQKSDIAVDPQETDKDLIWLAGLWEGEGHMSIICQERQNHKMDYRINIGLANTDEYLILAVAEILDRHHISAHIETRNPTKPDKYKVGYYVTIYKLNPAKKLCELLCPYFKGHKLAVAKLILRFINSRLNHVKYNEKYSIEEISLYEQIKKLNHKGPSETTRETSDDEDIVQSI